MNAEREQKETLRHVVMEYLAVRHPGAFPARAIRRTVAAELDFPVSEQDIADTCAFLVGMERVSVQADDLGSTQYFSATAAGVLAYERRLKPTPPRPD